LIKNIIDKLLKGVAIIFWIAIPFILLILPADQFDQGVVICPSKCLLNLDCPGCGLTRATMHLIHFHFTTAWNYNKISFVVFPILIMIYFHVIGRYFNKKWFGFIRSWYSSGK
jgi:hypothetical protein